MNKQPYKYQNGKQWKAKTSGRPRKRGNVAHTLSFKLETNGGVHESQTEEIWVLLTEGYLAR